MDPMMDEHMKQMWAGQSNVLVSVRVRPLMKHDVIKKSCVRVMDNKVVIIMDPAHGDKADILRANRNREKQYAFDYVFDPSSPQESAYLHTTKFLIHGVLDGFNATVFAYGQTGSGKVIPTHFPNYFTDSLISFKLSMSIFISNFYVHVM